MGQGSIIGYEINEKTCQISPTLYREKHRNYTGSGTGMERRAD